MLWQGLGLVGFNEEIEQKRAERGWFERFGQDIQRVFR
jgi:hypothetical protein